MKRVLTIALIGLCAIAFAQHKKQAQYFYNDVSFELTNGCHEECHLVSSYTTGPVDYQHTLRQMQAWVKPYKIVKSSFSVRIKPCTKEVFIANDKPSKFKTACDNEAIVKKLHGTFVGTLTADSGIHYTSTYLLTDTDRHFQLAPSHFDNPTIMFFHLSEKSPIMQIHTTPELKDYTITFSPKQVTFINDSTFKFTIK